MGKKVNEKIYRWDRIIVDIDPEWDAIKDFFKISVKNKNWIKL